MENSYRVAKKCVAPLAKPNLNRLTLSDEPIVLIRMFAVKYRDVIRRQRKLQQL